jgi:hypothetical protein
VIGSIAPHGFHVDARQVGSTVRLVVRSVPDITFPEARDGESEAQRTERYRQAVLKAPIGAWLPTYDVAGPDGKGRAQAVACGQVSHPDDYTGTSMLTVHTIDLAGSLDSDAPVSVAADGDTVYGTAASLYITSNPRWWARPLMIDDTATPGPSPQATTPPERTEIHRFDISGAGAPRYVASGGVPGRLLNQYSLSEYDGSLRVATTAGESPSEAATPKASASAVYVLRSDTLAQVGEVAGLGGGERIYSVRFIGPVGYVVTFQQVDPLYTVDLRDPAAPRVTGELKLTGYSAYLHPAGDGRLIGVGQEASAQGRTLGTQVSLFDVSDPADPRRLARFHQKDSASEAEWDPHAFLYWPKEGLAVLPLTDYNAPEGPGALVLRVGQDAITQAGIIRQPRIKQTGGVAPADSGIRRCLIIGDTMWTLSDAGLQATAIGDLSDRGWIPFA